MKSVLRTPCLLQAFAVKESDEGGQARATPSPEKTYGSVGRPCANCVAPRAFY